MNTTAMFKISYGLFLLFTRQNERDNGCVVNTVAQVTDTPLRLSVTVNKRNLTCDAIVETGVFNISVLSEKAPFSIFERFGFQSGRTADKCTGFGAVQRLENGLLALTAYTTAFISGKVVEQIDLGSHMLFIAEVTACDLIGTEESVTYTYYQSNIKPRPQAVTAKGYRCKICNYVYEGDPLPIDFICPICKHGAADFEKVVS